MRIEEGKYYRTRDGRKVGPARRVYDGKAELDGSHSHCHELDGKYLGRDSSLDIVAEWSEGPVRTVTRQEIIPGTYDGVSVGEVCNVPDCAEPDNPARVEVFVSLSDHLDADQLERAAAVLTALAGALRDE